MKTRILVLACIIAVFGANFAWSQVDKAVRAEIPFQFSVGNATLPAGLYDFSIEALKNAIKVGNVKSGPSGNIVIVSRLWAGSRPSSQVANIVFNQVGEKYTFAELWVPGEDGYLTAITKEKHSYKTITVTVSR